MATEGKKPDSVKIIQIVSNTVPRPQKHNPISNETEGGGFSLAVYGLGDDGELYFFNHSGHYWEAA
jgi:hypothetical protein